ncbi:flagellar hook-basal body complex protein, partial [bacterium]|nr:flagellar hook-basal body complex protein [bacterium]MBU1615969.1 flagellar hook-basal body complex protein [bacterium]
MIGVFTTGLTGVNAHQQWLDNIADNVSNVNSDGFKKTRTTFADLMSNNVAQATAPKGDCTVGGMNGKQIGMGVGNATMEVIYTGGALKSTDNVTDLALKGDGFFIVNGGGENLYTRNGNFGFDAAGNLTYKANGFKVQGFDEQGILGDIKVDMNDIMAPVATARISFGGEINKDQAQGLDDVDMANGNTLKFKKVLGTDSTYNYYQTDADGKTIVANTSSTEAKDITLDDAAGTVTVNGQQFYLSNYADLDSLMGAIETATGVDVNYANGVLSLSAPTALDALKISETGDSLMGVKINTDFEDADGNTTAGLIQDYFDGSGEINQGNVIGTIDGRVVGGTVNGTSTGIMKGIVGFPQQSGPTATATGEIIGNLQGLFDGEGMATGEIKIFNGYLKGDVGALDNDTDVGSTPTTNAWIDGTISGSSIGSMAGAMTGYLDTTLAPSGCHTLGTADTFYGDFKVKGHTVGFAQVNTDKVYGEIIGDAGAIFDVDNESITSAANTIKGPGKIQGSIGGVYSAPTGGPTGARTIQNLLDNSVSIATANSTGNKATLDNVTVEGAVMGKLTGSGTGELYDWTGTAWNLAAQGSISVGGSEGIFIGTFTGDITGIAQGDILMDDTSKITGMVTGLYPNGIDHDGNGVADAYINIDSEGSLKGDFEGQVDIYGEIYGAQMSSVLLSPTGNPDWIRADVTVTGWAEARLYGDLEGTLDGEAHGVINGLIKHAAIDAQHFIGNGATMSAPDTGTDHNRTDEFSHLNIKFKGEAIGHIGTAIDTTGGVGDIQFSTDSRIDDIIAELAASGAYINGTVKGFLDVGDNTGQYLLGVASGKTILDAADEDDRVIEGKIKGEVSSSKAELEGTYDGYFTGSGEVEGHFEGTVSGPGSVEGTITGTITNAHIVGFAEGFIENVGPVSGMVDLDNVVFTGTVKGKVEMLADETIFGEIYGKIDAIYKGQVDAEKKDIDGLFSAANVPVGDFAAQGGQAVVKDGATATVVGREVTANENYKINQVIVVYDQLGQTTNLLLTLENLGDGEWNIITSDGGQGTLTFEKPDDAGATGSIVNIDYDGQYELDLDSIIQVAGKNEIVLKQ